VGEGVVTRFRGAAVPPNDVGVTMDLILGPSGSTFAEDELELAWEAYGEELMGDFATGRSLPGMRPWAYWKFELGEDPPDDDPVVRLAELGLLRDEEVAAIAERANEARMRIAPIAAR
jgi:hypothetical protein